MDLCETICLESKIEDSVHFYGWVEKEEKAKLYQNCSLFVLPSYNEGMPMSILESMSYGQAVISTCVGGIPTVIQEGVNGLLIEPGDTIALKNTICEMLRDDEKKSHIGKRAFQTVETDYNIHKNINALVELYESIL